MTAPAPLRLVRVTCDGHRPFTAGFVTDGIVRECAPILRKRLLGKTDARARATIAHMGWRAHVVEPSR